MRMMAVLVSILAAGCVAAPTDAPAVDANSTAPTIPTANLTLDIPAIGEKMPRVVETFAWNADHGLTLASNVTGDVALVPETAATSRSFLTGQVEGLAPAPWLSPAFRSPFELEGDLEVVVTFSSDQPGGSAFRQIAFPPVGGWIGAADRYAVFFAFPDAPDTIEANKVYTLRVNARVPDAKLFFREGESLAVYPYLGYEVGPGALRWHVNDADLSGVKMDHQHFNVSAPVATSVLDKGGELGPFIGPSAEENPQKTDLAFKVPADAVYVVVEVTGTGATPGHLDVDLTILAGATKLGSSSGPTAREVVVLGPSALAQSRDLVAHVTSSGPKGTFTVKATAYGPSA